MLYVVRDVQKLQNSRQSHCINCQVRTWVRIPYSQYLALFDYTTYISGRKINTNTNSNWKAAMYIFNWRLCHYVTEQAHACWLL